MVANVPKAKASGGSALKRLKKSLNAAGVIGQHSKASRSKKDRKKGIPKESGIKNDADKKLEKIRGEFNPFEQKHQKTKFEILGRKMKGTSGKPTLSKQIGEENRKKTLLVELKNKNRRGGIIDKRFGESNPHLTPEEKMLERFTRERQKTSKTSMFNLDDDDEDFNLTHYGQSLSTMDDFDDAGLGLSDDEEDGRKQMDANIVSQLHFGGFDDERSTEESERHKSKNEVMKEIIAKSKMHKLERQQAKQEDEALREDLDEELNDIRGLLETKATAPRKPLPSQSALFKRAEAEGEEDKEKSKLDQSLEEYSEYDVALRELALERRAYATDRTKTEEEIALEEKEKLEKAERARQRRMEGLDSDDEENDISKVEREFEMDLDEEEEEGDEDEDEEEEEEDEEEEEEDEDESDIEDLYEDEEIEKEKVMREAPGDAMEEEEDADMNEFGADGTVKAKKISKPKSTPSSGKQEIPYTFECPTTHDEFLTVLEGLEVKDCIVVTKRIRVLYHIKLAPENKDKLSAFLGVLIDHLSYLASTVSPLPSAVLDKLAVHIFDMAQQLPEASATLFSEKLKKMQAELVKRMKHAGSCSWPDIGDITLLRCLGQVFSTSDLSHPMATPAMLFMCQSLSQCRLETNLDMGRGLFLTLITFEYQSVSKRFLPEALNFLNRCFILLSPKEVFAESVPGYFPMPTMPVTEGKIDFSIKDTTGKGLETVPTIQMEKLRTEADSSEANSETMRLSLFQGTLRMFERYLKLYAATPAFVEVFEDSLNILKRLNQVTWHSDIQLSQQLENQIRFGKEKRTKTPLRLQSHRPIPIAQHLPKFELGYSMDRHYDPDRERAQLKKLEAQVKKEKKGALRELRKDNMFIARERAKERKQKDAEYNKMVKGVMSLLEGEQSEKNKLEREKGKK
ncbi:nucleolar protein 14 [Mycotypha africana]|uniref:nucleolar protein 14 n=1 Tax=Mycotypha africana TaxID=64632 RepID=UPI002301CD9E|nr:nucleolar protein 14 [Mycotypha africana]KAI8979383.1 nucleolar protein 14 [Mycotypha africana]